ncbi:hypothetical protein FSP39_014016 [Pinctada imbricata]|uniref:N-acetylphosphatidylethanolamine-hydrolyzing phospholipase D n=1 Tax=Pinctada imbricata TaxID=66713 RepID=A0AA88YCM5_PINIB|nr:hypothetical protein FSP39_014016 [Pinctada imbricata]
MADEASLNNIDNEEKEGQEVDLGPGLACSHSNELDQPGKEVSWRPFRPVVWKNPESWKTWKIPNKIEFVTQVKMKSSLDKSDIPKSKEELDKHLPIERVNFNKLENPPEKAIQVMWIGHASVLVQFDGISILCDPVFSEHIGPSLVMSKSPTWFLDMFTCKRYRKAPCTVKELQKVAIDVVLISHDHFDHLDNQSIVDIADTFPDVKFVVPMGIKDWLRKALPRFSSNNIRELKWWETQKMVCEKGKWMFGGNQSETAAISMDIMEKRTISIHCTPAQHWCQRGMMDLNTRLWCSWAVQGPQQSFFFGGDSGYCDVFKKIGRKYGPFTLAALPIGAYEPRSYMHPQHVSPEQAVDVHEDIRAKFSLGIHWGTFKQMGCFEHYLEPPKLVEKRLEEKGLELDSFQVINHGAIWQIPENPSTEKGKDHKAKF